MAIREIVKEGNDCLRKVCRPVEKFDERLAILLDDMAETMYEGNGVGLAAPQVGVLRRVVVIDCGDRLYELINPEIIAQAGALDEAEGCLSSPGEYALVRRPEKVAVRAKDRHGKEFVLEGDHLLARAICHECDHLSGDLFVDKVEGELTDVDQEEDETEEGDE